MHMNTNSCPSYKWYHKCWSIIIGEVALQLQSAHDEAAPPRGDTPPANESL